ncbi:TlpA disulfide reductase family protein [Mucilaginibacter sp. CAU 1740]|uniref:TlpA family protein disulfide reductase n=1 Tax=Mucilaginibacter sp. CAU 1740 TaxID=3140365 RepID=UPI00325BB185
MKVFIGIFYILVGFSFASCNSNPKIQITGFIKDGDGVFVKIKSGNSETCYDSTYVKNNKFIFSPQIPKKGFYHVGFYSTKPHMFDGDSVQWISDINFYADDSDSIHIQINDLTRYLEHTKYSLTSTSFTERKLNDFEQLLAFKADSLKQQKKEYEKIADSFMGDPKRYSAYIDTLNGFDQKLANSRKMALNQFIKGNNNTIIVPYEISRSSDLFDDYTFYKKTLDQQSQSVKQSSYYEDALNLLKSVEKISRGGHASKLYGKDLNGHEFDNNFKNNKLILVNFWASWCVPCREEIPELKKVYSEFKNKGFDIVSVTIDEKYDRWKNVSEQEKMPWTNIGEIVDQFDSKNIKNFVVKSVPTNYLISADGKILNRNIEVDSLRKMLKHRLL